MKPITNILLVAALACYIFLPFHEISFQGTQSGFFYTAGLITQDFSVLKTLYALLPFIACFSAIGVNSLKNRYWGFAVAALTSLGLVFLLNASEVHVQPDLTHDPELMYDATLAQGFEVTGLGIGYQASLVLTVMAMLSALLSMLPFKFNRLLEEQIDHSLEEGKKHLSEIGTKVSADLHHEIDKFEKEHVHHKGHKAEKGEKKCQAAAKPEPSVVEGVEVKPAEDPNAAYMPKQPASTPADDSDNPYRDYMPK